MGNYWGEYTGSDTDGDGIGDMPYCIDSDNDSYPLVVPWAIYFAPVDGLFTKLNMNIQSGSIFVTTPLDNRESLLASIF
jgi:hypothetical protein